MNELNFFEVQEIKICMYIYWSIDWFPVQDCPQFSYKPLGWDGYNKWGGGCSIVFKSFTWKGQNNQEGGLIFLGSTDSQWSTMSIRRSVLRSVRRSVRRSVGPSVCPFVSPSVRTVTAHFKYRKIRSKILKIRVIFWARKMKKLRMRKKLKAKIRQLQTCSKNKKVSYWWIMIK